MSNTTLQWILIILISYSILYQALQLCNCHINIQVLKKYCSIPKNDTYNRCTDSYEPNILKKECATSEAIVISINSALLAYSWDTFVSSALSPPPPPFPPIVEYIRTYISSDSKSQFGRKCDGRWLICAECSSNSDSCIEEKRMESNFVSYWMPWSSITMLEQTIAKQI